MSKRTPTERLQRKVERGFQGYPVGTIAFYGPDDRLATKVAVGVVRRKGASVAAIEKWIVAAGDVRNDIDAVAGILAFVQAQGVRTVVMSSGILGCPHEEGIDYALGGTCPECPFWAGRERPI